LEGGVFSETYCSFSGKDSVWVDSSVLRSLVSSKESPDEAVFAMTKIRENKKGSQLA
jgi:hypothetical protein